jgi:hypothetical protein
MKSVTPGNPPTLQLLRTLDGERQTNQTAATRPKLKVVDGTRVDKPRMPASTSGVQIQISEEGRALVARLAQKTEHEYMEEPSDVTISRLVAEGIEEGFWE